MEQNMQSSPISLLAKKSVIILSTFVFLLPVFFLPVVGVNLYVAKITLLATGLVAMFAVFLSAVLSTGVIEMPKVKYLVPLGLFAIITIVSSATSGAIASSIAGSVFDLGTSGSVLMLIFAMFITIVTVRSIGVVSKVISAFIYSSVALMVYTLLTTFGMSLIPASIASRMPTFLSGGLIDTSIIFGVAIILSLCSLNMSETSKRMKIILSLLIVFSMLFIGATNFVPVVIILGVASLILFVYILSWSVGRKEGEKEETSQGQQPIVEIGRKISFSSLVVLILSVLLFLGGTGVGGYLSKVMRVQTTEVRPNFQTTMDLTLASWQKNFALGIGPNRFSEFWALHRPLEINQTQFWNSDFYSGSGFIPTIGITTGLLGLLALLAFIGMYVLIGVKAIFAQANASRSRYLSTASFLVSLYLWAMLFFYTPSIVVLALTFIFTGIFTATLVPQGIAGLWKTNIFSNPKTNFLSVLAIVVLLIMSVAGGYFVWERAVASVIFERGISQYQKIGNIQLVKESTARAIGMVPSDVYWRGLTEISLIDLGGILGGITNQNQVTDVVKTQVQTLIASSVDSAKKAVQADNNNFQNWFELGRVYEVLTLNGMQGSLEDARNSYNEAALRSPNNPSVPLALARLDSFSGNISEARKNIEKALTLKSNYTDAYFTLAQLEVSANNIPAAIKSVESAAVVDPNNSGLYFQLGLLKYNQKDFTGATLALERAVSMVSNYANAKYFLGLSYYQIGKKEEAIKQFEDINSTNPDNAEVKLILSNMKDGKSLFSDAKLPVDNTPQSRTEPPVKEN